MVAQYYSVYYLLTLISPLVLFQWQPEQPQKLFITLSGTDRVKAVLKVINEEMDKLTAVKKIETPPIKRGLARDFELRLSSSPSVLYFWNIEKSQT